MASDDRSRQMARLHALMAHTVANGCTEDEEISAARMAGKLADEIMANAPPPPSDNPYELRSDSQPLRPSQRVAADHLRAERESTDYRQQLTRSTQEGLLKSAIQELAMAHLNQVAPPPKFGDHRPTQMVDARHLLLNHLSMALGVATAKMSREVLADTLDELILDGMLPARLPIPIDQ